MTSEHGAYWCAHCKVLVSAFSDNQDGEWHSPCGKQVEWLVAEDATPLDAIAAQKLTAQVKQLHESVNGWVDAYAGMFQLLQKVAANADYADENYQRIPVEIIDEVDAAVKLRKDQ